MATTKSKLRCGCCGNEIISERTEKQPNEGEFFKASCTETCCSEPLYFYVV